MMRSENTQAPTLSVDRRNFLKICMTGAAAVAMPGLQSTAIAQEQNKAVLKLCSQEGRIPGGSLQEKLDKLESWGAVGIEFGGNPKARIKEIQDAVKGRKIGIAALCWGAHSGDLVSMDMEKRKKGIEDIKDALTTAGELKSTGVIFVPAFHKQSSLQPAELDKILFDILPDIGEYAVKVGSRVLIEPLNKKETFYINRLEQALAICEKIKHPGICMMGDMYHMSLEETDQKQAFIKASKWIHHVHLATKEHRILPGQEEHSYVEGFRGLKTIGYQDYCSLECGCKKGSDPAVEIPKAFELLRKHWEEATV
jgi:sugar phosphate isomerase/epimerase